MAKMIPAAGPQETGSPREKTIYALLKRELSDEFTVIHSLPWLCAAVKQINPRYAPTGEIDFLVIHPELGVLALEVKGGEYRVEGLAFVLVHSEVSTYPIRQTRRNVHGLAEWLGADAKLRLLIGYALVFPDSDFGDAVVSAALVDVTVDPPRRILVDKGEVPRISMRVPEIMAYWQSTLRTPPLGHDLCRRLVEALCPQFDGTPDWAVRVRYDDQLWLRLTDEQSQVVAAAGRRERMVITGWPGTGKTLIGIEVARRVIASGKRVLVVTFNNLLCDHLNRQVHPDPGEGLVSTWHGLCAAARRRMRLPPNQTPEWFRDDCLTDLQAAIAKGFIDDYDVLVLDEAQALRPDWCQTLIGQFSGKTIIAFCDETQLFSFETTRTSLGELCSLMGGIDPFFLTIVLRMPRAVTDRLLSVRNSQYQLTSPRESESDTIQELLVNDRLSSMRELVQQLKEGGLQPQEILVLTRFGLPPPFDELTRELGLHHETVSRFRGLEAPAIIVPFADRMDDAELFCAYSRATTVCVAMYHAETLGCKPEGDFQRSLLLLGQNQVIANDANIGSLSTSLMATQMAERFVALQTVRLAWSSEWEAWLVELEGTNDPSETWIDYLASQHPWPIFFWDRESRRDVARVLPGKDMSGSLVIGDGLKLLQCDSCEGLRPHRHGLEFECMECTGHLKIAGDAPTSELLEQLAAFDEIIRAPRTRGSPQQERTHALPVSLGAVGARRYAFARTQRRAVLDQPLPTGRLLYRAASAHLQARIAFVPSGQELVLSDLSSLLYERYEDLRVVSAAKWHSTMASAFATCFQRNMLRKCRKGVFVPVDD